MTVSQFFYYFSFGSNLLRERIQIQSKTAAFYKIGLLRNFRLSFTKYGLRWKGGVATVLETPGEHVWGCVWKVPNEWSEELDKQESGYHRLEVPIECEGETITCRTYQCSQEYVYTPPSPHYKTVILAGAKEHNLPAEYIEKLKAIPDNGYRGRVDVDVDAIKHLQVDA